MKEFKIWTIYTINSFSQTTANRLSAIFLLLGKIIRFSLFLLFLTFFLQGTKGIGIFSREQIIFFYLSFNLSDTLSQFFFREAYRFRSLIINGSFDLILTKPVSPLLRVLLGGADLLDLIMLVLLSAITFSFAFQNFSINIFNFSIYVLLMLNGLIIAFTFHLLILGFGILTTSVENLIMVYRETSALLRIPVDLYVSPLRFVLTYILPLAIMFTFPAYALFGIINWKLILISVVFSLLLMYLSFKFWNFSLKKYSSAGG